MGIWANVPEDGGAVGQIRFAALASSPIRQERVDDNSGDHYSDDRLRYRCKLLDCRQLRCTPGSGDHARAMIA
jgi:hypothetical protein